MKSTRRSLIASIFTLIVAVAVTTASTFAWFAMTETPSVGEFQLTVTSQDGLLISATKDGDYKMDLSTTELAAAYDFNLVKLDAMTPNGVYYSEAEGKFVMATGEDFKLMGMNSAGTGTEYALKDVAEGAKYVAGVTYYTAAPVTTDAIIGNTVAENTYIKGENGAYTACSEGAKYEAGKEYYVLTKTDAPTAGNTVAANSVAAQALNYDKFEEANTTEAANVYAKAEGNYNAYTTYYKITPSAVTVVESDATEGQKTANTSIDENTYVASGNGYAPVTGTYNLSTTYYTLKVEKLTAGDDYEVKGEIGDNVYTRGTVGYYKFTVYFVSTAEYTVFMNQAVTSIATATQSPLAVKAPRDTETGAPVDVDAGANIDAEAANAMRIAMVGTVGENKTTLVYNPNDKKGWSNETGFNMAHDHYNSLASNEGQLEAYQKVEDATVKGSDTEFNVAIDSNDAILKLAKVEEGDEVYGYFGDGVDVYAGSIDVYVWVEGKDADCFSSIYEDILKVNVGFIGVAA